jgi:glycogen debranching enzyme
MGDSEKAGNRGKPATPRDGAAIELQALLHNCVDWLSHLVEGKIIEIKGIQLANNPFISWEDWSAQMRSSFEKYFYVPVEEEETEGFILDRNFVRQRGIYKDTVGSELHFSDYQFRPNQFVAMSIVRCAGFGLKERLACGAIKNPQLI